MSKFMKQNIFFIEPTDCTFSTPSKIGNLLMNRLVVDEDASFEILKILEFSKEDSTSNFYYWQKLQHRKSKGTGFIIINLHSGQPQSIYL